LESIVRARLAGRGRRTSREQPDDDEAAGRSLHGGGSIAAIPAPRSIISIGPDFFQPRIADPPDRDRAITEFARSGPRQESDLFELRGGGMVGADANKQLG
jgi:hypothetical protein